MPKRMHRVLLVEDDQMMALHVAKDLMEHGYEVQVATTASSALAAVKRTPDIDVIVTDMVLPDSRSEAPERSAGLSLLEALRKKLPRIPVIIYSAYLQDRYREFRKLGAFSVLSKMETPPHELVKEVEEAIQETAKEREKDHEQAEVLASIREVLVEEIGKFAPLKERTIHIPDEGPFQLIKPLVGFKQDIEKQLARFPYRRNVFLMMKFRRTNTELSDFIIESLAKCGLHGVRADHSDWNLTRNVYNPIAVLYCCKYGIALFDEPEPSQAYSANVAYELGMMHYQNKDCLILKHSSLPQVPFDLIKDLYVEYEKDLQVRHLVTRWLEQVAKKP